MKSMRLCATLILSATTLTGLRLTAQGNPPPPPAASPPAALLPATPPQAAPATAPAAAGSGAIIQVDNPKYDFGKAMAGEKVLHTYVITNTGNAVLHITKVAPSCHCTTVGNWTHDIEPGKTGEITVQLDTTGFGGGAPVQRMVTVTSDAKNDPRLGLQIKGTVWKPIDVSPNTAMINIAPDSDETATATVRIVNHTENPVTVSNAVCANHSVTPTLKEIQAGKEYELVVTAQPPFNQGTSWATVTLNTSLTNTPTINVQVMVRVQPAIQIYPAQIMANLVPDRWTTNKVTIHSTTTNLLALSNPKASDSRIQVDLQSLGPKGMFSLVTVFPPGFKLEPGQHAEVTVESNHPRFPVIKIPITDAPHAKPVASWPAHANPQQAGAPALPANPNPPPVAGHP
jgi:hypothetical protein